MRNKPLPKGKKRKLKRVLEEREIEEEGTHPYHEKYTREGIIKE